MPRSPFEEWLKILEYRKNRFIFVVEWLSMFTIAWLFWSVLFFGAPGSVRPGLAAALMAFLYATCIVYDRLYRATGCRKCASPLPLLRKEVGRRHLRDEEHCMEVQYGAEEYGEKVIDIYRKVTRADMVTYRCRRCGASWEERVELRGSGYQLVHRGDRKE